MPSKPQISLLLRAIESDMAQAARDAVSNPGGGSSAQSRLGHLMSAADLALVVTQLAEQEGVDETMLLLAYEMGRALGPNPTPRKLPYYEEDVSDYDTEP